MYVKDLTIFFWNFFRIPRGTFLNLMKNMYNHDKFILNYSIVLERLELFKALRKTKTRLKSLKSKEIFEQFSKPRVMPAIFIG